jgi:hypothetical protein
MSRRARIGFKLALVAALVTFLVILTRGSVDFVYTGF